ncbi:predicted protein [Botrytis cinerea T4]|uniref:Uncharacterized protein n=1 Tax=Botryotinia fuckeliana (strain T4) TaxID=999810 RepID=G2XXV6_BOTF4|nr:predicted protein [Botrytis cinerea T4]
MWTDVGEWRIERDSSRKFQHVGKKTRVAIYYWKKLLRAPRTHVHMLHTTFFKPEECKRVVTERPLTACWRLE